MVVPQPWIYMSLSFNESLYASFIRDFKIQQCDENDNV